MANMANTNKPMDRSDLPGYIPCQAMQTPSKYAAK